MEQLKKNIRDNIYIMKDVSQKKLRDLNYHYDKNRSDNEFEFYSRKFPVYKHYFRPEIECVISIDVNTGIASINVYTVSTGNIYAPFYQNEYGNYEKVMSIIHGNIISEINRIGLTEV